MKIICKSCKKLIGEIEPLEDSKETKAKCSDCLKIEKDAEIKRLMEIPLAAKQPKERVVTFENGAQGFLTIADKETRKLGFWGILFEGKDFFCCEETRNDFEKYLESLPTDEVDVTFWHSSEIHLDLPERRKGKKHQSPADEKPKRESIDYNCTVRGTKDFARHVFQTKENQLKGYIDLVLPIAERLYKEEKLKAANQNPLIEQSKQ